MPYVCFIYTIDLLNVYCTCCKDNFARMIYFVTANLFYFVRNALSLNMLRTLHGNLSTGVDDLRVIILSSDGPVWSAGHDLKELVCKIIRNYIFDKVNDSIEFKFESADNEFT